MISVRPGCPADLAAISAIQAASPEAAQWKSEDYLRYELLVAETGGQVVGFLLSRRVAEGESEVLNLAVSPEFRRRGIAGVLLRTFLEAHPGAVFLEVRESNTPARQLYKAAGFQELSVRPQYYEVPGRPPESAIVMKFHSCYCANRR